MPGSAIRSIRPLASDGPSTSRASGCSRSSSARTLRAEPGPWWRMPRIVVTVAGAWLLGHLAARLVELAPAAVAFLHHRLQVLTPHGGVLDRIADDRAGQPGGDVVRLEPPLAEMRRE